MARRGGGEDGAGVGGAEGGELAGVLQEDADVGVVGGAPAEGGDGGGGGGELFLLLWGHGVVLLGCEDGEGGHPGRPRFARAGGAAPMAVRSVGDGAAGGAASGGDGPGGVAWWCRCRRRRSRGRGRSLRRRWRPTGRRA